MYVLKVLVCADGATSKLATKLGIITTPPSSQCSRAYVEGGTHKLKADGVVFWNSEVLPGKFILTLCLISVLHILHCSLAMAPWLVVPRIHTELARCAFSVAATSIHLELSTC